MTLDWVPVGPWRVHTRLLGPSADELDTAVSVCGDVVLVHGLGMSGRYLLPVQRLLAEDFRVFAPDLPGFGRSTRPARPLTLPELADALVTWMDAVGLERAGLFGHSLGCQVAAHVADRHPDRVSCLVLGSPSRDPRARQPWQQALRLLADAPREAPSLLPIAVSDYLRAGPWRMWRTLIESMQTDATDRLRRLRHPALVVRGERDPVVSAWWADRVTNLLSDGELVVLPGAPHGLVFSSPDALAQAARPFLAEHT
ncbi:alpha/beta hydrolase [Blastococcus sp. TF02-09]|uniref:alpha/beta fold hydrolase n=1 Tax=Blastococcus sp. TF02-09 TaxID=2250576 RepID=UPI000DEB1425|nr:alpha/beta hydrolase [Blastococcus sp. TF02-9]RBY78622.1 alpha/beta hydrolase [Blastococcus sp. TF02-9]